MGVIAEWPTWPRGSGTRTGEREAAASRGGDILEAHTFIQQYPISEGAGEQEGRRGRAGGHAKK